MAGARWVNAVPAWCFDEAGVPRPRGEELHGSDVPFHLVAGRSGPSRTYARDHGMLEVDMPRLVARLRSDAEEKSATFVDEARVIGVDAERVTTTLGVFRGRFVVDATGYAGVELLGRDPLHSVSLCVAAQELRRVTDVSAAKAFFRVHDVTPGEAICFTAVAGGYSVVNVRLDGDAVSILTGSIPALGHASGRKMLDSFVADHRWIGETIQGGARAIPLGRPRDRLVRGRHALAGDAACQVFPAHGSGIAPGLLAAKLLVASIVETDALETYEREWHRGFGGVCAGYEMFRRFSETLRVDDLAFLLDHGVMNERMVRRGLEERMPEAVGANEALTIARGLARRPALARGLAASTSRMFAMRAAYAAFPSERKLRGAWERGLRVIEGAGTGSTTA